MAKQEDEDFRKSLRNKQLDEESKKIEEAMKKRDQREMMQMAQAKMLERMRMELED